MICLERTDKRQKAVKYIIDSNGCHICISHSIRMGYPIFYREGKHHQIARYLYEAKFGQLPRNIEIRHKCDNPLCINLEHLEPGTHADNMRDMVLRNRSIKGERHSQHKLTEKDVLEIRKSHLSCREVGKIYGVSNKMISDIKRKIWWKHI